jgi:hypothetical protein
VTDTFHITLRHAPHDPASPPRFFSTSHPTIADALQQMDDLRRRHPAWPETQIWRRRTTWAPVTEAEAEAEAETTRETTRKPLDLEPIGADLLSITIEPDTTNARRVTERIVEQHTFDLVAEVLVLRAENAHLDTALIEAARDLTHARQHIADLDGQIQGQDQALNAADADRDRLEAERDQARAERDAVYRERAELVAYLAAHYPAVLVTDAPDAPGWAIIYINLPTGQASWHLANDDVALVADVETVPADDPRATWDQHSTELKYQRLHFAAERVRFGVDPAAGTPRREVAAEALRAAADTIEDLGHGDQDYELAPGWGDAVKRLRAMAASDRQPPASDTPSTASAPPTPPAST